MVEAGDCITWSADGSEVVIYDEEAFEARVLPSAFGHANMTSFVRQVRQRVHTCVRQHLDRASGKGDGAAAAPRRRRLRLAMTAGPRCRIRHAAPP